MGRKELLALMVGASTISYVGRTTMAVAGPEFAKQFQFSEAELGQIFSAFWLGYGLMMWPSGWIADRIGAGRALGICGLITAVLLAGNAAVSVLAGFLALRLLFGVASAVLYPACGSLSVQAFPASRIAGVQGLVVSGSNLGAAIAPLLVVWLSQRVGWRGSFLAVAGMTAALFLVWVARVRDQRTDIKEQWEWRRPSRWLVLLALQAFFVGYVYSFTDTWSFYYFREVRHFPEEQSALFATLLQLAGLIMMPAGGLLSDFLADRYGRMRPAFWGLAGSGVLLGLSTLVHEPTGVLAVVSAAFSLIVACEGVFWWAVLSSSPENPAAAYGFANAVGSGAQFLAPLVYPWIAARWGWDAGVHSAGVALVISAFLWRIAAARV